MSDVCPHCGYCKHCGRGNQHGQLYPPSPYPYWYQYQLGAQGGQLQNYNDCQQHGNNTIGPQCGHN